MRLEVRELVEGSFLAGRPGACRCRRAPARGSTSCAQTLVAGRAARRPIGDRTARRGCRSIARSRCRGSARSSPGRSSSGRVRRRRRARAGARRASACASAACRCTASGATRRSPGSARRSISAASKWREIARGQTLAVAGLVDGHAPRRRGPRVCCRRASRCKHGARVRFHQGTSEVLGASVGRRGRQRPRSTPGARAGVRVRLESPAALTRGDRFILRAYSPTRDDRRRRSARSRSAARRRANRGGAARFAALAGDRRRRARWRG